MESDPAFGEFLNQGGGSVRGWATRGPRRGRAQAPGLCAGVLSTDASGGGGTPPPWTPKGAVTTAARSFSRPLEDP